MSHPSQGATRPTLPKLIVSVAPVGHWGRGRNNPISPEEIATETAECAKHGASMVHLHTREEDGVQTARLDVFNETLRLIKKKAGDIVIQGSTGGVSTLSLDERCAALDAPGVEVATLNMGSTNLFGTVYANSPDDVAYWAKKMKARKVKPEHCIFEVGMLAAVDDLVRQKLVRGRPYYNFSLGFPGAMPASRRNLMLLLDSIPADAPWFYVEHDMTDFRPLALAIALGGHVRVGFEDSQHLTPSKLAKRNYELVATTAALARAIGREIATPDDTRRILDL